MLLVQIVGLVLIQTELLRGTVLGDNCVVGAGSVIKGEYPARSVIIQKRNAMCVSVGEKRIV